MIYAVHHFKVSLMSNKCAEFENHHQSYISGHPGKKTYKIHLSHWNWNTTSLVQWASVRKQAETSSCHRWPDTGFLQTQHEWSYCQLCSVYVKLHPFGPFRSSNRAFPCSSTLSKQFDGDEPLTQFNYQDLIDNFLILLLHICKSVTRIIMVLDQGYVFYLKCEFYHYMFAGYWMDIVGRSYMIITSGSWRVKYQWKRLISNKSPLSWSSEKNVMDISCTK